MKKILTITFGVLLSCSFVIFFVFDQGGAHTEAMEGIVLDKQDTRSVDRQILIDVQSVLKGLVIGGGFSSRDFSQSLSKGVTPMIKEGSVSKRTRKIQEDQFSSTKSLDFGSSETDGNTNTSTDTDTNTKSDAISNTDTDGDTDKTVDSDVDGVPDQGDNCPSVWNPHQVDSNGYYDGIGDGDACESIPECYLNGGDSDGDGICDFDDNVIEQSFLSTSQQRIKSPSSTQGSCSPGRILGEDGDCIREKINSGSENNSQQPIETVPSSSPDVNTGETNNQLADSASPSCGTFQCASRQHCIEEDGGFSRCVNYNPSNRQQQEGSQTGNFCGDFICASRQRCDSINDTNVCVNYNPADRVRERSGTCFGFSCY